MLGSIDNERTAILQISLSNGGVPKSGVHAADVNELGIVGDYQHDQRHHGGPDRALCLYSLERILALQAEGHPIFPGSVGENITTVGLDMDRLLPGMRLRLGNQVRIEITSYTTPCQKIRESFFDGNSNRILQRVYPGWSRVYARILDGGRISVGDHISLIDQLY